MPERQNEPGRAPENPARQPASSGAKVVVACNHPAGIRIRPFKMVGEHELVMGGGSRSIEVARVTGSHVLINGNATPHGLAPRCRVVAGYAITEGVDKETWDNWYDANVESAIVINNLIFAHEKIEYVESRARELGKGGVRSGLEPMAKDGDPRRPRSPGNLSDITEAEERASKVA